MMALLSRRGLVCVAAMAVSMVAMVAGAPVLDVDAREEDGFFFRPLQHAPVPPEGEPRYSRLANATREIVEIEVDGMIRKYLVSVPPGMSTQGAPVIINCHPWVGWITRDYEIFGVATQLMLSELDEVLEENPTHFQVLPLGYQNSLNAGPSCCPPAFPLVDDVKFVSMLIDDVVARYGADARRFYAMGMSNGGFFSFRLGVDLADKIAAIAPSAGSNPFLQPLSDMRGPLPRAMPILAFHGTADTTVPYAGAVETVADLRLLSGCDQAEEPAVSFEFGDTTCLSWTACPQNANATFCTTEGADHYHHPGSQMFMVPPFNGTDDLSATREIVDFFSRFSL